MSDNSYETAAGYVREGALGKVVQAQIDYSRNSTDGMWMYDIDADARPGVNLDWKAWLGPAPARAWDPERYFRWRRYWDYSAASPPTCSFIASPASSRRWISRFRSGASPRAATGFFRRSPRHF